MADFNARGHTQTRGVGAGVLGYDQRGSINSGGSTIINPTVEVPVPVVAPSLGLPVTEKQACLAAILPNGTDRYVGLFTSMPDLAGVGGTEASGASYARVVISSWTFQTLGHVVRRVNTDPVVFPTLTGDLTVIGWGIWDDPTAGALKAFGRTRNAGGAQLVFSLASGDTPQFLASELKVGLQ